MLAYHAKQSMKDHYLAAAEFHAWTDQYQQGLYFDPKNLRGCAVGCWTKDPMGGHADLALEMGIPEELLRLADQLFESLPEGEYQRWPYRFAEAIPPGADLGGVRSRFLQWLLFDKVWGLSTLARLGDVGPVLRDMKAYFDWQAEGLQLTSPLEADLQQSVLELIVKFKDWHQWDEYAKPETRASRALIKVWEARHGGERSLAEAAWSCRAAWAAQEAFTAAMTEAFLQMLVKAPVMVDKAEPKARPVKISTRAKKPLVKKSAKRLRA